MTNAVCPTCAAELPPGFRFCGNCGHRLDAAPAPVSAAPVVATPSSWAQPPTPVAQPTPAVGGGERREVAVLFADVSGFTAMCERLDPEDVHTVMNECFAGLGQAIQGEGGHIDKYIGDNVMALFGAPTAHEDDPARACRAALEMQGFLRGFAERCEGRTGVKLRMRIGINCGLVIAGGVGSDVRMDYSVMGDTVNLASRLESAAPPGGVLISHEVARRTRGLFELGPARQLSVKGKEQPVEAYELLREHETLGGPGDDLSVGMVGRERELRDLSALLRANARWSEVRGDLGVGKTRLVEEAVRRCELTPIPVVATTSARRALGLVRRLVLAVMARVTNGAPWPRTRATFVEALAPLGADPSLFVDALWHLAAPSELAVPPPDPDPQTTRRMIERSVVALIDLLARSERGLVLFLDSWETADDASASLLQQLATAERMPMPIVVAARSHACAPADGAAVIELGHLTEKESGDLLDRLVRGADLPPALRAQMLQRAAGVPVFLHEMVRALIDQGALVPGVDGAGWTCGPSAGAVAVPSSVRAAMVARLDTLDRPHRDLISQCSTQGVEFDAVVAEIVRRAPARSGPPVATLLPDLDHRGFVADLSRARPGVWAFRQPLMQEAAYETLLLRERRALHVEIARALCEASGGAERVAPELLAHHYDRADEWALAADANVRAGDRTSELFLNDEAIARYERAIDHLRRLDASSEAERALAASAHRGLARVLVRLGRYAAVREHAAAMRARSERSSDRAEADRLDASALIHMGRTVDAEPLLHRAIAAASADPASRGVAIEALFDLSDLHHRAGRTAEALGRLAEARARAATGPLADAAPLVIALRADMLEASIAHTEGRFAEAARLYARAWDDAEQVGSLSDRARAANNLGNVARDVGDYAGAAGHFRRALEIWERTGDAECIAGARTNLGNLAMSQGDLPAAREHHQGALAACRAIQNVRGTALAEANLAILALEAQAASEAIALAEDALRTLGESDNAVLRALTMAVLGEARLAAGDGAAAEKVFAAILRDYDEASHPLAITTAWRGQGRLALLRGALDVAAEALDRALAGFERLQRAQESARTALYRAEVLWRRGRHAEAREEIGRVRARFVAMGAEQDRARADQLLSALATGPSGGESSVT